jgi:uncharacterized protein YggE
MRFPSLLCLMLVPLSGSAAQGVEDQPPRIIVTSAATISTMPDRAVISFTVHGEGATSDEAVSAMVAKRTAIESGLTHFAAKPQARTAQVSIAEVRGRDCNRNTFGNPRLSTGECVIVGYTADLMMEVRTAAVTEAGTIVSLAGRLGATNPRVDRFLLAEDKAARRRGIVEALGEAKLQAEAIAHASGASLGRVISVSNLSFNGPGPYDDIVLEARSNEAAPPPPPPPPVAVSLTPRMIETQVRVQVVYAIAP